MLAAFSSSLLVLTVRRRSPCTIAGKLGELGPPGPATDSIAVTSGDRARELIASSDIFDSVAVSPRPQCQLPVPVGRTDCM